MSDDVNCNPVLSHVFLFVSCANRLLYSCNRWFCQACCCADPEVTFVTTVVDELPPPVFVSVGASADTSAQVFNLYPTVVGLTGFGDLEYYLIGVLPVSAVTNGNESYGLLTILYDALSYSCVLCGLNLLEMQFESYYFITKNMDLFSSHCGNGQVVIDILYGYISGFTNWDQ